jgi:serine/threonine protein kinase
MNPPLDPQLTPLPWEAEQKELLRAQHLTGAKYQVGKVLSRDELSTLFEARDLSLHRRVAMKVMVLSRQPSAEDLLRFIQEAQVLSQLEHPTILPLYEVGADEDSKAFFTVKFFEGETLEAILQRLAKLDTATRQAFPREKLLTLFRQVCDGIAHAHARGVIHRDLKPEHILVGANGSVAIVDWGLAKFLRKGNAPKREAALYQTMSGMIMGTPDFMSPEQAEGHSDAADERTDVYALGGILYYMLALQPPITGATLTEKIENARTGNITPPAAVRRDVPRTLSKIAMKALAYRTDERYQRVTDLQRDVELATKPGLFARLGSCCR